MSELDADVIPLHRHPRALLAAQRARAAEAAREALEGKDLPPGYEPIWEAQPAPPEHPCPPDEAAEAELVAILAAPRDRSKDADQDFGPRERQVYAIVDGLALLADLALSRRVARARADDPLTQALAKLCAERRGRIVTYITDGRRRAIKSARRR